MKLVGLTFALLYFFFSSYVFSRKNTSGDTTYWRCSVRNKNRVCPPTAIQRKDIFTRGRNDHNHEKLDGLDLKVKVTAKAKKVARENVSE